MKRTTSLVIILVFAIINLRLSESRIFHAPNVWLMMNVAEDPEHDLANLKPVSPQDNVNKNVVNNKQLPLKKNPVELVQEQDSKGKNICRLYI